jgi:serine/threonine protein phosphatase PrpC
MQREHNEDKYDQFDPEMPHLLANRGRLWAVADGMGGHAAGQRASEFGLRFLLRDYFLATDIDATTALSAAIMHANGKLVDATKQHPEYQGMGSTLVALVLIDDVATIAHVGDSRAYLLRQGAEPQQLTQDHSWVEDQVRAGTMTRDEAEQSRYRNVISRCLGMEGMPGPDIQKVTVQPGDVFVIVSDGITRYMQTDNIAAIVSGKSLSQAAMDIVDAANLMGGADNSTCVLVRIDSIDNFGDGSAAEVTE